MSNKRTALLLINLGTPDKPTISAVSRYLHQFLNDKHVITVPWLFRKLLVNLIIIPFRVRNSTKLYKKLWTSEGSPLAIHTKALAEKLQKKMGEDAGVFSAMRYQNPSIRSSLQKIREQGFGKLIILPLYPQFASSTTTSTIEEVERIINKWDVKPEVHYINQFYNHPGFLDAFSGLIRTYSPEKYDFTLFSFHGLPKKHITKLHPGCKTCDCSQESGLPEHGRFCYRAACYHTALLLAKQLNLPEDKYTISFQSRLSRNWLEPFSDKTIIKLAQEGFRRVLVVAPTFVADCLETNVEIGIEYKKLFIANGGEELTLVESLNANDRWVDGITGIVSGFIHPGKQQLLQHSVPRQ